MKLSTILMLAIVGQSNGLSCPELTRSESITSTLTMYYAIVPSTSEPGILCARLESQSEAWIGFGINPSGGMIGAEAVIGLPNEGTVKKYLLNGKSASAVVEMDDAAQTLMDTSILQENGVTSVSFTKFLDEDQYSINEGSNSFIYAVGSSNDFSYHAERGSFTLELEAEETSTSSSEVPPSTTTSAGITTGTFDGWLSTSSPTAEEADASFTSPTYSPSIGETEVMEDANVTYSPTTAGTLTVGNTSQQTPAPSVISKPRTALPTIASESDGVVAWNQTSFEDDDEIDSNSTVAETTDMTSSSSTIAVGNETESSTPSPTVVEAENVTSLPTVVSTDASTSNSTNATQSDAKDGTQEENAGSDFSFESANQEGFNGAAVLFNGFGSLFIGVITLVAIL